MFLILVLCVSKFTEITCLKCENIVYTYPKLEDYIYDESVLVNIYKGCYRSNDLL